MADSPDLKPVYLLTGSDRPKIETALAPAPPPLRARGGRARLAPRRCRAREAAALCNVGSLFGDARLVVVEGVDGRRNAEGRLANGWKAADVKAIEEYLASPAPGTVLALVAEELKKDAPLTKACAKAGEVLAYEVAEAERRRTGSPSASSRRARAPSRTPCAALVQLVGEDFHQLANEIDKLALWAGGRADRRARGRAARRGRRRDADVRAHGRLGAARRRPHARRERDDLRAGGPPAPRHGAAPRRRARQPPRLHAPLPAARRRGRPPARRGVEPEAASVLRREGLRARRRTSPRTSSATAVVRLAALDHALKGGSKLTPDLELQRALIDLSAES